MTPDVCQPSRGSRTIVDAVYVENYHEVVDL